MNDPHEAAIAAMNEEATLDKVRQEGYKQALADMKKKVLPNFANPLAQFNVDDTIEILDQLEKEMK